MLKTQFTASNNTMSRQIFKNKIIKIIMHNHTFVKNVLLNNEIKTFTKQRRSKIDENPVAPSDKRYLKGRKKVIDLHSSFSHDFYLVVFHIFLIKERTSVLYIYRIIGERLQFAFRYFVSKNINLEELALTERERERERERMMIIRNLVLEIQLIGWIGM